jgi:hypothetical protein
MNNALVRNMHLGDPHAFSRKKPATPSQIVTVSQAVAPMTACRTGNKPRFLLFWFDTVPDNHSMLPARGCGLESTGRPHEASTVASQEMGQTTRGLGGFS